MKSVVGYALILMAAGVPASSLAQERSFSVKDDIAMVRFSDPRPQPSVTGGNLVQPSPDGRYFAFVTTKGLLKADHLESEIKVFDRVAIDRFRNGQVPTQPPQPRTVARIVSFPHEAQPSSYAPVIKDMQWAPDAKHIYFRGENAQGNYRLYCASVDGSRLQALTPPDRSIDRFDVEPQRIAYRTGTVMPAHLDDQYKINEDAEVVTGRRLQDVLFANQIDTVTPKTYTLGVLSKQGNTWRDNRVPTFSIQEVPYLGYLFPFSLSPSGDALITVTPVATIPPLWREYVPAPSYERLRFGLDDEYRTRLDNPNRPLQYSVVDVKIGKTTPLVDAPNGRALAYLGKNRAVWSPTGKRVFVTNTFTAPLPNSTASGAWKRPCAVASIDIATRAVQCLSSIGDPKSDSQVAEVKAGETDNDVSVLVMSRAGEFARERFRFTGNTWELLASEAFAGTPYDFLHGEQSKSPSLQVFDVVVRQDLNTPPTLWIVERDSKQAKELWNPNPQIARLRLGQASPYHWSDSSGQAWNGALIKPVDYDPTKRYPLVIQMYSFEEGVFLTDGTDPTAFAARHLASVGIMVLQVQKKATTVTEADAATSLEGYRSAIEALSNEGLIDRTKVGVVGFSWTCWYALNALVKAPSLFAAATIADGLTNSYMEYLLFAEGSYALRLQMEKIRGASPFGSGLNRWVAAAPGFHLDQITTPLRLEAITPISLLSEWELYASLHMQDKAIDFIYFPRGMHIHQRPLARLESQQGSVDWLRFWLQGYEDHDPSKANQYRRWNLMKKQPPTVSAAP